MAFRRSQLPDPFYEVNIGYALTNQTSRPVSTDFCRTPTPPTLEKALAGHRWASVYSPVVLTCRTEPPVRVATGATYRGPLAVSGARRRARMLPVFDADSVRGVHRLRWVFPAGPNPDDHSAPLVEAISPAFRLARP